MKEAKSLQEVFTQIFIENTWGSLETVSGFGSEIERTKLLRKDIEKLIEHLKIKSILDIPCGDYNWMKEVLMPDVTYIGADIVEGIIILNKKRPHNSDNCDFKVLDITKDELPKCDLIIVRDLFVHLSNSEILTALKNIKKSNCSYLLTTTFPNTLFNSEIKSGKWRTINLEQAPFNLTKPDLLINEKCNRANGKYNDKSLGLWNLKDLK